MANYINLNGKITPANKACIGVNDLGLIRGYGIFDYFKVIEGQPLFLDDYVERFLNSAELMYLDLNRNATQLKDAIFELLEANKQQNTDIRLIATGGYSSDGYTPENPQLMILQYDPKGPAAIHYQRGIKLLSIIHQREIPQVKTTNYSMGIRMLRDLKAANAFEVLYLDGHIVREAVRSNIFIVNKEGQIITPNKKILWGITRKYTLEVAKAHFDVEERDITYQELREAKEIFLTSSTKKILPVVAIDDFIVGYGKPGPVTKRVMSLFEALVTDFVNVKI